MLPSYRLGAARSAWSSIHLGQVTICILGMQIIAQDITTADTLSTADYVDSIPGRLYTPYILSRISRSSRLSRWWPVRDEWISVVRMYQMFSPYFPEISTVQSYNSYMVSDKVVEVARPELSGSLNGVLLVDIILHGATRCCSSLFFRAICCLSLLYNILWY